MNKGTSNKDAALGCLIFILIILTGCWAVWVTVEEDGGIGDFVGNLTLCSFVMIVLVTFVVLSVKLLRRFWQWWWAKLRGCWPSDEAILRWEDTRRRIAEHNDMLKGCRPSNEELLRREEARRRSDKRNAIELRNRRRRAVAPRGQHSERTFEIIVGVLGLIFLLICIVLFIVGLVIGLIIALIKYGPLLLLLHLLSGIGN